MTTLYRSLATIGTLCALSGVLWVGAARSQIAEIPDLRSYYSTQKPPEMDTLIPTGAVRGSNARAGGVGNLRIVTYTSTLSYKEICRFYTEKLLPPDSEPQVLGVQGDLKKQSGYAFDERGGSRAASFCQRTAAYTVSAVVHRSMIDKETQVTLLYSQNEPTTPGVVESSRTLE